MPDWVQWVGGAAAFVLAVSVLWGKVVRPGASLISLLDRLIPLAEELVEQFHDDPEELETLSKIAKEFPKEMPLHKVIRDLQAKADRNQTRIEDLIEMLEQGREKRPK